jgi:hypothetical protein
MSPIPRHCTPPPSRDVGEFHGPKTRKIDFRALKSYREFFKYLIQRLGNMRTMVIREHLKSVNHGSHITQALFQTLSLSLFSRYLNILLKKRAKVSFIRPIQKYNFDYNLKVSIIKLFELANNQTRKRFIQT